MTPKPKGRSTKDTHAQQEKIQQASMFSKKDPSTMDCEELMSRIIPFALCDPVSAYFGEYTTHDPRTSEELLGQIIH